MIVLALAGIVWIALVIDRSRELAELKALLPGAETLSEDRLLEQPGLFLLRDWSTWVYAIDATQQSALVARCRSLEGIFPKNDINSHVGCLAAFHEDPEKFRYTTLTIRPGEARLTADYMSATDYDRTFKRNLSRP